MRNPAVSVVIPTLNRPDPLCKVIQYFLGAEAYRPFELIVIDQSDRENPGVEALLRSGSGTLQYVRVPYRSLPKARNNGVRLAKGEIIVFIDDDAEPWPGFLRGHVEPYANPGVVGVAGPIVGPGQRLLRLQELTASFYRDLVDGKETCFQAGFDYPAAWAPGGNMSFRRDTIRDVGWFDENFSGVAVGEDAEFSHRVVRAGGVIYYSSRAGVWHRPPGCGGCHQGTSVEYVASYVRNVSYLWGRVSARRTDRWKGLWRAARRLVLNRRALQTGEWFRLGTTFVSALAHGSGHSREDRPSDGSDTPFRGPGDGLEWPSD